jgi:hypothetical protein
MGTFKLGGFNITNVPSINVLGDNASADDELFYSSSSPAASAESNVAQNVNGSNVNILALQKKQAGNAGALFNLAQAPNVFFNLRSRPIIDTNDFLFKFETSSLTDANFTSAKLPSWVSKSGLQVSPITLQASSGSPLKVVKAYGKYFYELDRLNTSPYGTTIKAEVVLPIKTEPSYTILVYAVGRASLTNVIFPVPLRISGVHLFCDASSILSATKTFNIGNQTRQVNGPFNMKINLYNLKASFVGNTLNSKIYSIEKTPQRASYNKYINIFGDISNSFVNADSKSEFFNSSIIGDASVQNYYSLDSSNISYSSTNINTPSDSVKFILETANGNPRTSITSTQLDQFSLYFVEMFSYMEGYENGSRTLKLQTFVNGMLTYDGSMALSNSVAVNNTNTFLIRLSSDAPSIVNGQNPELDRMFLFDYLHGTSNTSAEQMKIKSKKIIESLAYDYRNILLKSQTDLQIRDKTFSLGFQSKSSHPFLKIFSKGV